jgi:hypothetical protein
MKATIYKNTTGFKCNVLKIGKCRLKALWMVMESDGKPYMSRLNFTTCSKHLIRAIRETINSNSVTLLNDKDEFTEDEFKIE